MNHTPASRDEACNGVRGYGLNEQVTHTKQYILANGNKEKLLIGPLLHHVTRVWFFWVPSVFQSKDTSQELQQTE